MVDAVVVASSRTPLAKSFRGSLNLTRPDDMLAHCLRHVVAKVPELSISELEDAKLTTAVSSSSKLLKSKANSTSPILR